MIQLSTVKRIEMKNFFRSATLIFSLAIISCKKTGNNDNSQKLALIQHTWSVVSINGEALRYEGTANDYYNFAVDHFLYRYIGTRYDTSYYQLSADGASLLLYPVVNGTRSNAAATYHLTALSETRLVLSASIMPGVSSVDSLKR